MKLLSKIRNYRQVIKNFFSLSIINGVSYVLALATVPYLTQCALGIEKYGSYIFMYAIAQYLLLIGNYGFKFSATRLISVHRDNREKINELFNATIAARLILTTVAVIIGFIPIYLFMQIDDCVMYLFALGMVYGDIFIPTWLFQGMEEMKYLTVVNVLSKLIFAAFIFVFINTPGDYIYVILLNSFGYIMAGLLSMVIAIRRFNISFKIPEFNSVIVQYKEGWHIFISNIGMEMYRNSNVLLLGIFVNDAAVGVYGAVEKVVKAIQTILNALPMALFPHISKKFYSDSKIHNISMLRRMLKYFFVILSIIALIFAFAAPLVSIFIDGHIVKSTQIIVWIISPVLLFGCMNYLAGIVGLVNLGFANLFQRNVWFAGVSSIIIMLLFVKEYSYYAAALAWSWAEMFLFFLCLYSIYSVRKKE